MSLRQLNLWCDARFGPHMVASRPDTRAYDIPWLVLDNALAEDAWGWKPLTTIADILEEIASHAEKHPNWLDLTETS